MTLHHLSIVLEIDFSSWCQLAKDLSPGSSPCPMRLTPWSDLWPEKGPSSRAISRGLSQKGYFFSWIRCTEYKSKCKTNFSLH